MSDAKEEVDSEWDERESVNTEPHANDDLDELEQKFVLAAIEQSLKLEMKYSVESTTLRVKLNKVFCIDVSDIEVTRVPGDGNCLYHSLALAANERGVSAPTGSDPNQGWTHLSMRVLLTTYMNRCLESETWQRTLALTYDEMDDQIRPLYDRDTTLTGYGDFNSTVAFACYFGFTVYVICESVPSFYLKNCMRGDTVLTCAAPKMAPQMNGDVFIKFQDVGSGHYDYISTPDATQTERLQTVAKIIQMFVS
ncbi:hypothetical protein CYMTET_55162 [Cymbomonas tetramitiformis]|uniref:OTU domain-containing protein n=1 Tax=Cymbomonas tetramitiformis TaxID=36881 RepID=A0AAE0BDJ9_9CHLO|nr:hypothetical protein CYMTET_55162 [Cymbomonas tetramitiformis]